MGRRANEVLFHKSVLLNIDEFNACYNKTTTENPECAKFDFISAGYVDNFDRSVLSFLKSKLQGLDGNNKIPAGTTKTFTITTEMPNDSTYNYTGDAIKVLTGDINVIAE
jgi:hypothetical protein